MDKSKVGKVYRKKERGEVKFLVGRGGKPSVRK
jgi:hypothetical protein